MRIDFDSLPRLRQNQRPLTDAETTAWLEGLSTEFGPGFACDEGSIEDFFTAFVTDILPYQSVLSQSYAKGIAQWVKASQAHVVADWVISHPTANLALLDTFVRINTFESLLQLQMIAYSRLGRELVKYAWLLLEEAALVRGLRVWELQNVIVPTCGMSSSEPWLIDYGSQRFGIRLNTELGVVLVSESRRVLRELPVPTEHDDLAKVAHAQEMFRQIVADLEDTIPTQMMRFETALVEQLRWRAEHWKSFVLGHPVLSHLAQRLLWAVHTPGGRCVGSFRVGDDSSLSDSNDEPFQLLEEDWVGVLHPLDITNDERDAWGSVLGDYELPTLFPQIDRPVFKYKPEEAKLPRLARVFCQDVEQSRTRLLSRGWQGEDGENDFFRFFRTADIRVELVGLESNGMMLEMVANFQRFLGYPQHSFELRDVPKVVFSEVSLELESLGNVEG